MEHSGEGFRLTAIRYGFSVEFNLPKGPEEKEYTTVDLTVRRDAVEISFRRGEEAVGTVKLSRTDELEPELEDLYNLEEAMNLLYQTQDSLAEAFVRKHVLEKGLMPGEGEQTADGGG